MNKVNQIALVRDNYDSQEEWQNEIAKATMLLVKAGYIMVSRLEDFNVFIIEYEYDNRIYGCDYPYWLSPTEFESVVFDDEENL